MHNTLSDSHLYREDIHSALVNEMIQRVRTEPMAPIILAKPPLIVPPSIKVWRHPSPLPGPNDTEHSHLYVHRWRSEGMETLRTPALGCVIEGEADMRFRDHVVSIARGMFFLIPQGVPQPDGSRPHWERANPESAKSRILWMLITASGARIHTCRTEGLSHSQEYNGLFVRDNRLSALVGLLAEELGERKAHCEESARSYLLALLLRVERELAAGPMLFDWETHPTLGKTPCVQRACEYIQAHLHQSLLLERIALHSGVSASHLKRLFRAETGFSVMDYVTQCRIESAKPLLADTDLTVQEISQLVGFAYPSYFARVFLARVGQSPMQYRDLKRGETPAPETE